MKQIYKDLGKIMKPKVISEIQKAREEQCGHHDQQEALANSLPRIKLCHPLVTGPMIGVKVYVPFKCHFVWYKWKGTPQMILPLLVCLQCIL